MTRTRIATRLVVVLTSAGGGCCSAAGSVRGRARQPPAAAAAPPPAFAPNASFASARRTGHVVMNQVEMGQGAYTSMPMLMAEELEVGLDQVQLEQLRPTTKLYAQSLFGDQERVDRRRCARSTSRCDARSDGRTMLLGAAAQTWDVDPASCRAKRGVVTHTPAAVHSRMARWPKKRANCRCRKGRAQGSEGLRPDWHTGQRLDAPDKSTARRSTASTCGCGDEIATVRPARWWGARSRH